MINWVLVVNIMQVRSATLAMLVHKKDLVVGVEMNNVVLGVETRCKTCANMIANHDRVTNMQVSHGGERQFGTACTGHADVQSSQSPCTLQGFQGDVTCISTQVMSLDTEQFVKWGDRVASSEEKERAVQRVLVGHEVVCSHGIGENFIPLE